MSITIAGVKLSTGQGRWVVDVLAPEQPPAGDTLNVQLVLHDDVDVSWFASIGCAPGPSGWQGALEARAGGPHLVEVRGFTDAHGDEVPFHPTLHLEPSGDGEWTSGGQAEAEKARLHDLRTARFFIVLTAPTATPKDDHFKVLMVADNLHLTVTHRLPGIGVTRLENVTLGSDVPQVINDLLPQLGFEGTIEPTAWIASTQTRRPSAAIVFHDVLAPSAQEAVNFARNEAMRLVDLLAYRRGAKPRLIAGVVGRLEGAGRITLVGAWPEGDGYTGNLLGGFISGEDPYSLLHQWESIERQPRVRLWLSLYADALADGRWEYRLFRCLNLLEGIATEVVPPGRQIADESGATRLQDNGRPYTTREARGKLFELVRVVSDATETAKESFAVAPAGGNADLWEDTSIWLEIRNAVAHTGAWARPEGEAPSTRQARVEAALSQRGHDGTAESGAEAVLRAIRAAVDRTLQAALAGLI